MELALALKRDKGYDIFVSWSPHVNRFDVRHSESFIWDDESDSHFYHQRVYLDQATAEYQLNSIIKHLEGL